MPTINRPLPAPPSASPLGAAPGRTSRRGVVTLLALFGVGVAVGLVELVADRDKTSSGAGVAVANGVHVAIAVAVVAAGVTTYRRNPKRARAFLISPFTSVGWRRLLDASLSVPCALAEVALVLIGRRATVARIERWRVGRVADDPSPTGGEDLSLGGAARVAVGGLVTGVVLSLAAFVVWFTPLRAGEQVFAALDHDFTRDAWGGPGYLGASLAHWMDGFLMFYAATVVLGWLSVRRGAQPHAARPLAAPGRDPVDALSAGAGREDRRESTARSTR